MSRNQVQKRIYVYAHWTGFTGPELMGELKATPSRGKEVFSFEYEDSWLESDFAQVIDPDLGFYGGPQYLSDGKKSNFGLFLDSSPDRWGRLLMRRREAADARTEKREERKLIESDYLLGVYDAHRMGGLRFKTAPDGEFLNDGGKQASPPWTSLRELEQASLELERDGITDDPDYLKWLGMLIVPGSSLGGARPKASVTDESNHLWIGKFPSRHDDYDLSAWEMVAHRLAGMSGISVAEGKLEKFSSRYRTFLTKRFDRTSSGERIHFSSAMTMLGRVDGAGQEQDAGYLDLAEFIIVNGSRVDKDLEELWRRIVFSIAVSNTDDHLRNHGFLLTAAGWELSPAYDINPNPLGAGLSLNVSENDNSLRFDLALGVGEFFRLRDERAREIMGEVVDSAAKWEEVAKGLSIPKSEIERMKPAFRTRD